MADIIFSCPGCGQTLQAPPEWAGAETECPTCAQSFVVPEAEAEAQPAEQPEPEQVEPTPEPAPTQAACPECSAPLAPEAVLCLECGYHLKLGRKITTEFS